MIEPFSDWAKRVSAKKEQDATCYKCGKAMKHTPPDPKSKKKYAPML